MDSFDGTGLGIGTGLLLLLIEFLLRPYPPSPEPFADSCGFFLVSLLVFVIVGRSVSVPCLRFDLAT